MSAKRKTSSWVFRKAERHLYGIVAVALSAGFLTLFLKRLPPDAGLNLTTIQALAPLACCLAAMAIVHTCLVLSGSRSNPLLLPAVFLLSGLGVMLRYRFGLAFDVTSLSVLAYPVGLLVLLGAAILFKGNGYRILARMGGLSWLLSVLLMGALLLLGTRFRGAVFASGNLTPTELLKPLMVVFIAAWLAPHVKSVQRNRALVPEQGLGRFVLAWGLLMVLLAVQRDLGMMLMLNATLLMMIYAASANVNALITGAALVGVAGIAAYFVPHVQTRFVAWIAPWTEPTGSGWQILQALSALYSGGLLGSGFGEGQPQAIPVASSDFIYAALGEELGYIGCGLIILCYLLLWRECFIIAGSRKEPFARILAIGLVSVMAIQTVLNIGGVTKALPVTGVPLPFISHGGSNFIVAMLCIGLLLALSDDAAAKAPVMAQKTKKRRTKSRRPARKKKPKRKPSKPAPKGRSRKKPTAKKRKRS